MPGSRTPVLLGVLRLLIETRKKRPANLPAPAHSRTTRLHQDTGSAPMEEENGSRHCMPFARRRRATSTPASRTSTDNRRARGMTTMMRALTAASCTR